MKNILLVAAFMAFNLATAQETVIPGFSAGDTFVSGSFAYGSVTTDDVKSDRFNLTPRASYFVSSNIAIGAQIGFSNATDYEFDGINYEEVRTTGFEFGAFGRYYFTPASRFSLFGQLSAGYATAKREFEDGGDLKVNGIAADLAPGINYFISDNFALEATFGILGYTTVNPDAEAVDSTNTFNIGLDMSDINFGIVYKF